MLTSLPVRGMHYGVEEYKLRAAHRAGVIVSEPELQTNEIEVVLAGCTNGYFEAAIR